MTGKKKTVIAVLMYLILTVGLWMFLYSYANSYNRLTDEKIESARLTVADDLAELELIGEKFVFEQEIFPENNKAYFIIYVFTPAELRGIISLMC